MLLNRAGFYGCKLLLIQPSPSLTKCYKYNSNKACCRAVHDEKIQEALQSLLPKTCDRKYGDLEDFYCVGCDLNEPTYNDQVNKTLTLCLSFVKKIWNATTDEELLLPTTIYDNCGFKTQPTWNQFTSRSYVTPSMVRYF